MITEKDKQQISELWHKSFVLRREILNKIAELYEALGGGFVDCNPANTKYIIPGKSYPDYTYQLDEVDDNAGHVNTVLRCYSKEQDSEYGVYVVSLDTESLLRLLDALKNVP